MARGRGRLATGLNSCNMPELFALSPVRPQSCHGMLDRWGMMPAPRKLTRCWKTAAP